VALAKAPGYRKTSFGVSSCIHSAMRLASQAHDSWHLSTGSIELEGPMTEQRNPLTPDAEAGVEKSPAGLGSAGAAPVSGFANLEDKGGWLTFRVTRAGGSIPVRITRETMEDHFGAGPGDKGLAEAYLQHGETINAKVLELAPAGDVYSTENPLKLSTGDFE
jgi:hypothetical protein